MRPFFFNRLPVSLRSILLAAAGMAFIVPAGGAPELVTPYGVPVPGAVSVTLERMLSFLEKETPVAIADGATGKVVADPTVLPEDPRLVDARFSLISYEWGVTYAGMLLAGKNLDNPRFRDYVATRLSAIGAVAAVQRKRLQAGKSVRGPMARLLQPRELDHAGSMAAAMIKAARDGIAASELKPVFETSLEWIEKGQSRLAAGAFDRPDPLPHTLWLDDLYMSVPALAQMGVLTGDAHYFDEAVRQVRLFSERMFVPRSGLFMHAWTEGMEPHPAFYWGRANGWAILAVAELLSVLPEDHPGRANVLEIFRAHARGLAAMQDASGRWHQLLDRPDTFLETSSSAMFVYALARGVNRGWLDASAYGPMLCLGWNAVEQQVNADGEVENVCVGTGVGWDPGFYASRPVSTDAAHGYGPVLLAGAEMVALLRGKGSNAYSETNRALGVQFPQR